MPTNSIRVPTRVAQGTEHSSRVAIFVPSLVGGGAERVMVDLANAFSERGFAVDFLTQTSEGPLRKRLAGDVTLVSFQKDRVLYCLLPLTRYLRQRTPDALLSALSHANLIAIAARFLSWRSVPLVVSERGQPGVQPTAASFYSRAVSRLMPVLYPFADGISAVSNDLSASLASFLRLAPDKVTTTYNPFDLQRINHLSRIPLEDAWVASSNRPIILAVGRLCPEKDFFTLVTAFSLLRGCTARLVILGEGPLRPELEALASELGLTQDEFVMPGFVDNPYQWMRVAEVFVLSSRAEGLPGALIEAMACGTPVISTDCPSGPAEILEDGRWGRLVPVGDPETLAAAMLEVLNTPRDQLPKVRERAADFDEESAVNAYLDLLGLPHWADPEMDAASR